MPFYATTKVQINKDMETSQCLHSPFPYIPTEYDFDDLFCHDNSYTDTLMGIEAALAVDSPQQETDHISTELGLTDLLLVSAEAVDAENWHLASAAISRLDQLLLNADTDASPFLRLAHFFAHGLHLRLLGPWLQQPATAQAPLAPHDTMSPLQMLQELSPYVKFAHFTANQAILEATAGERSVHVLDLDVTDGLQWPPLMADMAARGDASLRITAVVNDATATESRRTGRRLAEFAETIGLALKFEEVNAEKVDGFQPDNGSVMIANCTTSNGAKLVGSVRRLSPRMVVVVQEEVCAVSRGSFTEFFCDALQHFACVSDSLVNSFGGGYRKGLRGVEEEVLGPRIVECVSGWSPACASLRMEGFRMAPLSACNVSQAKLLVGLFGRGYGVQHDKGRLALCWKSRPLTVASVWVPN